MGLATVLLLGLFAVVPPATSQSDQQELLEAEPFALLLFEGPSLFDPDSEEGGGVGFSNGEVQERRRLRTFKIPYKKTIREAEDRRWGVRVEVPLVLGTDRITLSDVLEGKEIDLTLRATALFPTLKLVRRWQNGWTVGPGLEAGVARESSGLEEWFLLTGANVSATHERSWGARDTRWESKLAYGLDLSAGGKRDDDFLSLESGFGVHFPTPIDWKGADWSVGAYGSVRYYFDVVSIPNPGREDFDVDVVYEVGGSFGPRSKVRLWELSWRRIKIGYRFGNGVRGIQFKFGGSF